ncbi:MAG: preprotein translocase subunit YajC [Phycisphaerales bacterium]|nr:preprotein translocase subunit YajC [Phycisphaerales bacterium]
MMNSLTEMLAQTGDTLSAGATQTPETQSTSAPPSTSTGAAPPTVSTGAAPPTASTGAAPSTPGKPAPPDSSLGLMFGVMVALMVFMWVMNSKRQKREQKQRADMLGKLGKNDRVLTIGGIIGTVVSVKESEVVLKVDESTNTKMTFARRAIQQVLVGDEAPKLEETR